VIGQLGLQETVAVSAWYIWWERREAKKGSNIKPPVCSAFSIQAITANHAGKIPDDSTELRNGRSYQREHTK